MCVWVGLFVCLFYVFLKCNMTMVLPGPNLVRSPLVSATLVSTMSTTFFAKRNVLNVDRFKVHAAASFPLVHDFLQQIRHSIPHHDTARYIRVHVQRTDGFSHDRAKRSVQVGETPTATHAQVQIVSFIHSPKLGVA